MDSRLIIAANDLIGGLHEIVQSSYTKQTVSILYGREVMPNEVHTAQLSAIRH